MTNFWVIVTADAADEVAETVEYNNSGVAGPIAVSAFYIATVQAGLDIAPAGTPVSLQGHATTVGVTNAAPLKPVNIHILVRGTERIISSVTDTNGNFATTFQPLPGEAGHYRIFATHPGVSVAPAQDEFDLLGMRFSPASASHKVLGLSTVTNEVTLENLGDVALSGLSAVIQGAPASLNVQAVVPSALPASSNVILRYTVQSLADAAASSAVVLHVTSAKGLQPICRRKSLLNPVAPA